MAKFDKKERVVALRCEGFSLNYIAEKVGISKSTASLWCRDIVLTEDQILQLEQNAIKGSYAGRLKGAKANENKRKKVIESYKKEAEEVLSQTSKRDLDMIMVGLYWGEGSKTENRFGFSNSDPAMVAFVVKWLVDIEKISCDDIIPRILINESHESRIQEVLKFWSSLLELPREQFRSTTFIKVKNKKVYENHDRYFGTLMVRVKRSSKLQYKLLERVRVLQNLPG